jgi:hypothetical protein
LLTQKRLHFAFSTKVKINLLKTVLDNIAIQAQCLSERGAGFGHAKHTDSPPAPTNKKFQKKKKKNYSTLKTETTAELQVCLCGAKPPRAWSHRRVHGAAAVAGEGRAGSGSTPVPHTNKNKHLASMEEVPQAIMFTTGQSLSSEASSASTPCQLLPHSAQQQQPHAAASHDASHVGMLRPGSTLHVTIYMVLNCMHT